MDTSKKDEENSKRGVFEMGGRRALGLVCDIEDERVMCSVLHILGDEGLTVDRASRVLTDAQTMLPILAKLPTRDKEEDKIG